MQYNFALHHSIHANPANYFAGEQIRSPWSVEVRCHRVYIFIGIVASIDSVQFSL